MSLVQLVVALILIGLALWATQQFPLDAMLAKIIRVVLIVVAILFVLVAFGLLPSMGIRLT